MVSLQERSRDDNVSSSGPLLLFTVTLLIVTTFAHSKSPLSQILNASFLF